MHPREVGGAEPSRRIQGQNRGVETSPSRTPTCTNFCHPGPRTDRRLKRPYTDKDKSNRFRSSTTHCGGCGSDNCPIAEDSGTKLCTTAARPSLPGYGIVCNPTQIVCSAIKHDHEAAPVAHDSTIRCSRCSLQRNELLGESAQLQAEEAIRLSSANLPVLVTGRYRTLSLIWFVAFMHERVAVLSSWAAHAEVALP
jgi:hypothetical protein